MWCWKVTSSLLQFQEQKTMQSTCSPVGVFWLPVLPIEGFHYKETFLLPPHFVQSTTLSWLQQHLHLPLHWETSLLMLPTVKAKP